MKRIGLAAVVLLGVLVNVAPAEPAEDQLVLQDGRVIKPDHVKAIAEGLVVTVADDDEFYSWDDLEPGIAYRYRAQQVTKGAAGHLELARFCIERGLVREAFSELDRAEAASPELRERIAGLRREYESSVRSGARVVVGPGMPAQPETDPEKILQEQRSRAEVTAKLLGVPVSTLESDNFIIHTTFDRAGRAGLTRLAEKLYRRFRRTLGARSQEEFVWTGKVVVYAFARREEFTEFSEKAHQFPGAAAGAYFRAAAGQAELVVPANGGRKRFEQDLTHEATHLLLHFYRHPGRIPNWLHEGMAQSFEFKAFRRCRAHLDSRSRIAKDLREKRLLKVAQFVGKDRPQLASDLMGYAYAWSFVDYLIERRRSQLIKFIRELKDGTESREAARKAFGAELSELEPSWVRHIRTTYR